MSNGDAIKHVIIVTFENRSFDHLLGWMSHPAYGNDSSIEGLTGDVDAATNELVHAEYGNPALNQTFRPFFVTDDPQLAADLPHGRDEVTKQMAFSSAIDAFSMRGIAASYYRLNSSLAGPSVARPDCMRMLTPAAAPVTAFLARNYCVCDHWFTPIPTDTHPNLMVARAGYTEIDTTGTLEPDHHLVFDWANENNISWRVYSDDFSFMMYMDVPSPSAPGGRGVKVLAERAANGHYRSFSSFAHDYQFDADFPAVTLIEPAFSDDPFTTAPNDNHAPLPMGPGEGFLLGIYNALLGTDLARKRFDDTMLVIHYDEHGGFFDHVPPLTVTMPSGRLGSPKKWESFVTSGPRVPAIVVSPRVDAGVFNQNLDHTSILRFLAERFTPGKGYSPEVDARHAQASGLTSVGDAVNRSTPRPAAIAPGFGAFASAPQPKGRPARTPGQRSIVEARKKLGMQSQ